MKDLGIYIHVPFCGKKCDYCDFYSLRYSSLAAERYVEAVVRNIRHYSDNDTCAETIYFGGGTPSLLSPEQLGKIIGTVKQSFSISEDAEITLEANPCTLSPERLSAFRSIGINRLSVGVQSMNDDELRFLGRVHSAERAAKAVRDAADAGFENISCDLMTGLPGQSEESLRYSLYEMCSLPVKHISAYILKTESGTPFDCERIQEMLPDDEEVSRAYTLTCEVLEKNGFMQYEISNFAVPGYESRHNCRYWKCQDYLGIGPAAHSCFNGKRFAVPRDLDSFIAADSQPVTITDDSPCGYEEFVMLRLRLKEGLDISDVEDKREELEKKIPALVNAGYAEYDNNILRLTRKGFLMSNQVIGFLVF